MNQYIWYHPAYIAGETDRGKRYIVEGQIQEAIRFGYTQLSGNELHRVTADDHLTLVGHSCGPSNDLEEKEDSDDDTGKYMQGETAEDILARLKDDGLTASPAILSLECCHAAVQDGLAEQLSRLSFFQQTLIEAHVSGVGRHWKPGPNGGFAIDTYGRKVIFMADGLWHFYLAGNLVKRAEHGKYDLLAILVDVNPLPSKEALYTVYNGYVSGFSFSKYSIFGKEKCVPDIINTLTNRANARNNAPNSASTATLSHFKALGYRLP